MMVVLQSCAAEREARRIARIGGVILVVTTTLADKTIRGFGTMIYAFPWGMTAFAAALIASARVTSFGRTGFALLAALVGFGFWDLVRTDVILGDFSASRSWRWEPTAEDRFLETLAARAAQTDLQGSELATQPLADSEWPEFRGPFRNGVLPEVALAEDWESQPLEERWRVSVGPGWFILRCCWSAVVHARAARRGRSCGLLRWSKRTRTLGAWS